jgi:hypothetical protein
LKWWSLKRLTSERLANPESGIPQSPHGRVSLIQNNKVVEEYSVNIV